MKVKLALASLSLALFAGISQADSLWTYTGNSTSDPDVGILTTTQFIPTPNPCNCALTGTLTLDANNNPIAWSFTEGAFTLNNTDSLFGVVINQLIPQTEPLFSRWRFVVAGANFNFFSGYDGSNFEATDFGPGLYVQGNKGSWTESIATPEPSAFILLAAGLVLFLLFKPR